MDTKQNIRSNTKNSNIIRNNTMLYKTIYFYTKQYTFIQNNILLYKTKQYYIKNTILYKKIQYYTKKNNIIQKTIKYKKYNIIQKNNKIQKIQYYTKKNNIIQKTIKYKKYNIIQKNNKIQKIQYYKIQNQSRVILKIGVARGVDGGWKKGSKAIKNSIHGFQDCKTNILRSFFHMKNAVLFRIGFLKSFLKKIFFCCDQNIDIENSPNNFFCFF